MKYADFISILYPKKCISCGSIVLEDIDICDTCRNELTRIPPEKRCDICGNPKKYCLCKSRIFYFEKCICVFENEGIAKHSYYRYKLLGRPYYKKYFIDEMVRQIVKAYPKLDFDAVCSVPPSLKSYLSRGFDHSGLLAIGISKQLGIPIIKDMLGCKSFRKPQHKSAFKERIENVRGKYYLRKSPSGLRILLIDDIRTTGSTLSECSHTLLLGGAENVRCAALLAAVYKNDNNKNGDINGN